MCAVLVAGHTIPKISIEPYHDIPSIQNGVIYPCSTEGKIHGLQLPKALFFTYFVNDFFLSTVKRQRIYFHGTG